MTEYTPTEARICIDFCNAAIKRAGPDGSFLTMEEADAAFSRWMAAHDAEVRASVLAEQGEPDWEYGLMQENEYVDVWGVVIEEGRELPAMRGIADVTGERIVRRRSPGPWLPIEEGETP